MLSGNIRGDSLPTSVISRQRNKRLLCSTTLPDECKEGRYLMHNMQPWLRLPLSELSRELKTGKNNSTRKTQSTNQHAPFQSWAEHQRGAICLYGGPLYDRSVTEYKLVCVFQQLDKAKVDVRLRLIEFSNLAIIIWHYQHTYLSGIQNLLIESSLLESCPIRDKLSSQRRKYSFRNSNTFPSSVSSPRRLELSLFRELVGGLHER